MSLIQEIQMKSLGDERGNLVAIEGEKGVPFKIKRVYYLFNTKKDTPRGFHAHKALKQVAICVSGSCRMTLDDGTNKEEILLDKADKGILIDSMIWHEMHDFSPDCVLLVLASDFYDEQDYIRNYNEFINMAGVKTKSKKLVIVGTGELAEIAYEYFTHDSDFQVVGFSVHKEFLSSSEMNGLPVVALENIEEKFPRSECFAFVAVPASKLNRIRTALYNEVKSKGYRLATYISSKAFVWHNARVGENCFIFEDNTIQPFVTIGNNVILWSGNHIGHRTVIEDNCFIASHAVISGYCTIESGSFVGVNSTFNDKTSLAKNSIVASGAVVTKKLLTEESVYVGNPAKIFPRKSAFDIEL